MNKKKYAMIAGVIGLTVVPTLWASGLLDRDAQRLAQAKHRHADEVQRAFDVYSANVERANERLSRLYERTISQYENRGDSRTAAQLQAELDALQDGALRSPFPDDDDESAEPAVPSHVELIEAVGPRLFNASGQIAPSQRIEQYDYIALYYTASWCMPCHRFTPKLIRFYENHKSQGSWEVIVVSGDREESAFLNYLSSANMPWAAVPFERKEAMEQINRGGFPRVIVLDREGEIVIRSGLGREDGEERLFNDIRQLLQ